MRGSVKSHGVVYGNKVGLGCFSPSENKFDGSSIQGEIFAYAIYSRALDAEQIRSHFEATKVD